MYSINTITSTIKPEKFQDLNNGFWHYNYNILETFGLIGVEETNLYTYSYVRIEGNPTIENCLKAILESYVDEDGVSLYKALDDLQLIEDIKSTIESDFYSSDVLDLDIIKNRKIEEISKYDVSPEVNSFILNGNSVWLDKATRVGLMNSLKIEQIAGKELSAIWIEGLKLILDIGAAILMLSSLELYALECYNKTAEHLANIRALNSINEIMNYDFTIGYPDKLNFTV